MERSARAVCLGLVPIFKLRVVNSDFTSCADSEATELGAAKSEALMAAMAIGTDHMCRGSPFFGAEVSVELDGEVKERFLVSMGQSSLQ